MLYGGLTLNELIGRSHSLLRAYGPIDPLDDQSIEEALKKSSKELIVQKSALGLVAMNPMLTEVTTTWSLMWASCGYPQIILRPKRAAYFASTQIKSECSDILEPPWPAFLVLLPDTEWSTDDPRTGKNEHYTALGVYSHMVQEGDPRIEEYPSFFQPGRRNWSFLAWTNVTTVTVFHHEFSLNWDSTTADPSSWPEMPASDGKTPEDDRMSLLFCQLIAGLALEFQSFPETKEQAQRRAASKAHRELVKRTSSKLHGGKAYVMGEDVVVDARPVVEDYIKGLSKTSPRVRSYVRPHPRLQRCGPQFSQVKLIRIEGYWKGPKDAPVNIRAHKFKDSDASES